MIEKNNINLNSLRTRFRGYYPVVIDIETSGLNVNTDAILEIAAITLKMDHEGWLQTDCTIHFHIEPFPGSILQKDSLTFNGIDPYSPLRGAVKEYEALYIIFQKIRYEMKKNMCSRAIIVAHNSSFDHNFLMKASERVNLTVLNPFHPFTTFDTASLSALVFGQTVLAKACIKANIIFNNDQAHTALYDTKKTAILFCELVNRWKRFGGWPIEPLKHK